MKPRHHPRFAVLALLLLPSLASCTGHLAPQPNPNPKHVVRVTGRIPSSLHVKFFAHYFIDSKASECTPSLLQQWGGAGIWNYFREDELEVKRVGEHYETTFAVDKYLPGTCHWVFDGVSSRIVRDGGSDQMDGSGTIISGYTLQHPDYMERCHAEVDERLCPLQYNSLDVPVVVPCQLRINDTSFPGAEPGTVIPPETTPHLSCYSNEKRLKREHMMRPSTTHVEVNYYDTEIEALPPDPVLPGDAP